MVDTARQLCVQSFEITAKNGDYWKAEQGKEYTTTVPVEDKESVTVFSNFWIHVPKKHFVLVERSEEPTLPDLLCIVSPNKKGFWHADVYFEGWEEGLAPDWCCSGKIGGTKEQVIKKAKEKFPNSKIIDGITGICEECGEGYLYNETMCECGGIVNEP